MNGLKVCKWRKNKCKERKIMKTFNQAASSEKENVLESICGSAARALASDDAANVVV